MMQFSDNFPMELLEAFANILRKNFGDILEGISGDIFARTADGSDL